MVIGCCKTVIVRVERKKKRVGRVKVSKAGGKGKKSLCLETVRTGNLFHFRKSKGCWKRYLLLRKLSRKSNVMCGIAIQKKRN